MSTQEECLLSKIGVAAQKIESVVNRGECLQHFEVSAWEVSVCLRLINFIINLCLISFCLEEISVF